jgi:two-component system, sensor histidine kinase and response regulator
MNKLARILLVEDDEDDYVLTSEALQLLDSYQFEILWVTSPQQASEKLSKNDVDICLLDNQLGAKSGLAVLKDAQQQGCLTPIIMLTGQTDATLDKSALDAGAVDYLNKQEITTERFARAIRYALARNDVAKERLERLKAETQNRAKDRFLAHLSHELRTPLTSILGYTELLLHSNKAALAQDELNIILSNGKYLLSLLNDILDLSKIAADKLELNPSLIHLDSFIADVFYLLNINAQDKGLTLAIEAKSALPVSIYADATRLRQILINLCYNAIKFTEQGKVSISMWLATDGQHEKLEFAVADTGRGIPAERIKSIFEPFAQADDMETRTATGAGLGLAICTELVKRMGGELDVESQIGVGSVFRFTLDPGDISQVERKHLRFEATEYSQLTSMLKALSGRILVVDDAPDIRQLITQIAQSFGLEVETAQDGLEAIEKCQTSLLNDVVYSAVLMDIHMPVMDGRQAIAKIRQLGFTPPVIAVTAAALKGVKQALIDIGFSDVLHKPINRSAMHQSLSQFLPQAKVDTNTLTSARSCALRILVVEDDPDAAQLMCALLESLGVETYTAHSGKACLQFLAHQPDVDKILIDLHLPDMSGAELAQAVHDRLPQITLIIVSGEQIEQRELDQLPVKQALLKPINLAQLRDIVAGA